MVLRDSDHCFEAFSGYSLAVRSTETPGNRDDLTDFCPVLRAGTKADLEKSFCGRSSGPYGRFAAWRAGREFYWKRYLNHSVGKSDLNEKICGHIKKNVPWHILAPRAVACDSLHLRASAHLWHVSAFSCNRKFRGISCYMKKAPSHEDAFISFPYLVKGGLSSLNETGS